jgi:hypothetical protein
LIPKNSVSKFELLKLIADSTNRSDLVIRESVADFSIDRTLATLYPENNRKLWGVESSESIPSISELKLL